jgi:hypothetical protein
MVTKKIENTKVRKKSLKSIEGVALSFRIVRRTKAKLSGFFMFDK